MGGGGLQCGATMLKPQPSLRYVVLSGIGSVVLADAVYVAAPLTLHSSG